MVRLDLSTEEASALDALITAQLQGYDNSAEWLLRMSLLLSIRDRLSVSPLERLRARVNRMRPPQPLWQPHHTNLCPACSGTSWHVGRAVAECGRCGYVLDRAHPSPRDLDRQRAAH